MTGISGGVFPYSGPPLDAASNIKPPPKVVEATEYYLDSEDTVGAFLKEFCVIDPDGEVSSVACSPSGGKHAQDNNTFIGSEKEFAGWMAERGFVKGRDRRTGDRMV